MFAAEHLIWRAILTLSGYKLPTAVHTGLSFLCSWHCRLVSLISCKLVYFLHQLKCYFSESGCRTLKNCRSWYRLKYPTLHIKCIQCIQPGRKVDFLIIAAVMILFILLLSGYWNVFIYILRNDLKMSVPLLYSRTLYGFSLVNLAVVCWMFLIIWSLLSPKN